MRRADRVRRRKLFRLVGTKRRTRQEAPITTGATWPTENDANFDLHKLSKHCISQFFSVRLHIFGKKNG